MTILRRETVVRYECPHCRATLEWTISRWGGWVACPACERASEPPAPKLEIPTPRAAVREGASRGAGLRAEQWIAAGDVPDAAWPMWSRGLVLPKPRTEPEPKALRAALGVGLAISLFLLLVGFLDQNSQLSGTAAILALLCFWGRLKLAERR